MLKSKIGSAGSLSICLYNSRELREDTNTDYGNHNPMGGQRVRRDNPTIVETANNANRIFGIDRNFDGSMANTWVYHEDIIRDNSEFTINIPTPTENEWITLEADLSTGTTTYRVNNMAPSEVDNHNIDDLINTIRATGNSDLIANDVQNAIDEIKQGCDELYEDEYDDEEDPYITEEEIQDLRITNRDVDNTNLEELVATIRSGRGIRSSETVNF